MAAELLDINQPVRAARGLGASETAILDIDQPAPDQGILDIDTVPPEPPSFLRHAAAFGARLVPPLVGAAAGGLLGPAGALAGAAAGGALGEMAGRAIGGQEQAVLPTVAAGTLSIVPGIRTASIPLRALEGAGQGALATTAMTLAEGEGLPGPGELAVGAGAGAGLGLLLRRAFDGKGYWFKPTTKPPVSTEAAQRVLTEAQERALTAAGPGLREAGAQQAAEEVTFQAQRGRFFSEADRLQAAERSTIETELAMERALPEPGRMEAPGLHPVELPPTGPGIPRVPGLEQFGQPPVGPVEAGGLPGLGPAERVLPPVEPLPLEGIQTGTARFPIAPSPPGRRIFGGGPLASLEPGIGSATPPPGVRPLAADISEALGGLPQAIQQVLATGRRVSVSRLSPGAMPRPGAEGTFTRPTSTTGPMIAISEEAQRPVTTLRHELFHAAEQAIFGLGGTQAALARTPEGQAALRALAAAFPRSYTTQNVEELIPWLINVQGKPFHEAFTPLRDALYNMLEAPGGRDAVLDALALFHPAARQAGAPTPTGIASQRAAARAILRDVPLEEALPAALSGDHASAATALERGVRVGITPPDDVAAIRSLAGQPPPRLHSAPSMGEEAGTVRQILSRIRNCQ